MSWILVFDHPLMQTNVVAIDKRICNLLHKPRALTHFWFYQLSLPFNDPFIRSMDDDAIAFLKTQVPPKKLNTVLKILDDYESWETPTPVSAIRRYADLNTIAKSTMQLSRPDNEYADLIHEWTGLRTLECFASPFNHHFDRFCSAFPDTDAKYGSLGTFQDVIHEAIKSTDALTFNPPYQLTIMERSVDTLLELHSQYHFRSICHLPVWSDVAYEDKLAHSQYLTSLEHVDIDFQDRQGKLFNPVQTLRVYLDS